MTKIPAFLLLSLCASGCARNPTNDSRMSIGSPVPAQAPDTVPGWVVYGSNIAGNYVLGVVGVIFHEGTSLADRQRAIDEVRGKVVGGWRFVPDREGIYAVQVDDDGDAKKHQEFIERLNAMPQIKSATRVDLIQTSSGP